MFFLSTTGNLILKRDKCIFTTNIHIYYSFTEGTKVEIWCRRKKNKEAWLAPVFAKCSEIHGDRAIFWQPPSHSVSRKDPEYEQGQESLSENYKWLHVQFELMNWWPDDVDCRKHQLVKLCTTNWGQATGKSLTAQCLSVAASARKSLYFRKKHKSKCLNKKYERSIFVISPSLKGNIPFLLYWV